MKRQTLDIGRRHAFCFVQRQRHGSSSYLLLTRSLVADMAVVTAEIAVGMVGMLPDMPRPGI